MTAIPTGWTRTEAGRYVHGGTGVTVRRFMTNAEWMVELPNRSGLPGTSRPNYSDDSTATTLAEAIEKAGPWIARVRELQAAAETEAYAEAAARTPKESTVATVETVTHIALNLVRAGRVTVADVDGTADCMLVDSAEPTDDALRVELENLYIYGVIDAEPRNGGAPVKTWVR
jgi:hypothetical protein